MKQMGSFRTQECVRWLFRPIDAMCLAYFRVAFGAIMLWEVWRYFDHGWISRYFSGKEYYFTYPGFGWVHPLPEFWMKVHFAVMGVRRFLGPLTVNLYPNRCKTERTDSSGVVSRERTRDINSLRSEGVRLSTMAIGEQYCRSVSNRQRTFEPPSCTIRHAT